MTAPLSAVAHRLDNGDNRVDAALVRAAPRPHVGRGDAPTPAVGPSPRLLALPQPDRGQLMTPEGVDEHLSLLEAARQAQLDALPPIPPDVVGAAHRGTVTWILGQIRTARQRLGEGLYGICARCETRIHAERIEQQPWVITCTACAPPDRPVNRPVPAIESE